ncbi:hypothetical protein HELRODRAFT_189117 [Helobdella robusta]|uniref:Uncharacterized protein n=1 Tax=Helobdella robusta TaxID=6412 RepID=T1FQP1_HELRO|nr:hypothetical protein HELRODRAFT_189117 [Helobdella robusta]ESN96130.1 hypothetical protein HELRODRAFT_189117 [Helobdella robusta]
MDSNENNDISTSNADIFDTRSAFKSLNNVVDLRRSENLFSEIFTRNTTQQQQQQQPVVVIPTFSTFKPVDVVESCVAGQRQKNRQNVEMLPNDLLNKNNNIIDNNNTVSSQQPTNNSASYDTLLLQRHDNFETNDVISCANLGSNTPKTPRINSVRFQLPSNNNYNINNNINNSNNNISNNISKQQKATNIMLIHNSAIV